MNAAPAGLLARKVRSAAHYTIPARVGKLVAWPYAVITPPDPRSMRPEKGNGVEKRRHLVLPLNLGFLLRISQAFCQFCVIPSTHDAHHTMFVWTPGFASFTVTLFEKRLKRLRPGYPTSQSSLIAPCVVSCDESIEE